MSSIQLMILLVPLLGFTCTSAVKWHMEIHTKHQFYAIALTVPYAGWIFHQLRQQRVGQAERVSKTKPHRCVSKLKGSIMYHPLLFLPQHLSSQHNTEERESHFPWAVIRQRLTVCVRLSVESHVRVCMGYEFVHVWDAVLCSRTA